MDITHLIIVAIMAFFVCFLFLLPLVLSEDYSAPTYVINLDLPPAERWAKVAVDYKHYFPTLFKEMEALYPKDVVEVVLKLADDLEKYIRYPYADEIMGIVTHSNHSVSSGQLLLGNIYYELTAYGSGVSSGVRHHGACTSIVAVDSKGTLYHGRNLDYSFSETLKSMTINVRFERGGKAVFTGTTFAGYVGILTGCRTNGISISMNERNQGEWWKNVIEALKDGTHGIVSLLIREVLQNETLSFKEAVGILSSTPFIAPCYLIVGGVDKTEAVVVTRDRESAIDQWYINPDNGSWFILETNYDHWKPPPSDDDRRDPGIKAMNDVGHANIAPKTLFKVLSTPPVLNSGTTYTTTMCTVDPKVYATTIR